MKPIEIKPGIYWVGVIDWAIRDFHGYVTKNGTTYNNYLVMDDEVTLLDTVKHDFDATAVENIRRVVDPYKIKNIVINHIEPDHASSIAAIMEYTPDATIFITERGKKGLDRHFDTSRWKFRIVKSGDTLKTGKYTLTFLETPMLHWPDSMVTYIPEAKLLISQDAFGQHMASAARFDDEFFSCHSQFELDDAIVDYYANILMPFGKLIEAKIQEIVRLGLEIDMIAPDHGIIWRKDPGYIIQRYLDLAKGKADLAAVIIYDTMWHSTELMSDPIMNGIKDEGVPCKVIKLRSTSMSEAIKEFWRARGCLIGTPTINNVMFPSVAEFLYHLAGLRPKDRIVGGFGSYGWGGGAVKEAYAKFQQMGLEAVEPGLQVLYKPSAEDMDRCYEFGRDFAKRLKEYHGKFQAV
ncbi:MAG TPA: FprA family A-type flavoprotein [Syntrophorhabdaceae bacterium]|nr:FprA family A-type flavoprotein [Syntrophorhabdaceae bacterium]